MCWNGMTNGNTNKVKFIWYLLQNTIWIIRLEVNSKHDEYRKYKWNGMHCIFIVLFFIKKQYFLLFLFFVTFNIKSKQLLFIHISTPARKFGRTPKNQFFSFRMDSKIHETNRKINFLSYGVKKLKISRSYKESIQIVE